MLQICRKFDLAVSKADKQSPIFFQILDSFMIQVKELIVSTEELNLKEHERQAEEKKRIRARNEARWIVDIIAKEETEQKRIQDEDEVKRFAEMQAIQESKDYERIMMNFPKPDVSFRKVFHNLFSKFLLIPVCF